MHNLKAIHMQCILIVIKSHFDDNMKMSLIVLWLSKGKISVNILIMKKVENFISVFLKKNLEGKF